VIHATARAPQIVLNMLMVAFLISAAEVGPQPSPNSTHRPFLLPTQDHILGERSDASRAENDRSSLDALCSFGRFMHADSVAA
jgi:hypothetical protein